MTRIVGSLVALFIFALALLLASGATARAGVLAFRSNVLPNRAGQVVSGFPASGVDWAIRHGRVKLRALADDRFLLTLRVQGSMDRIRNTSRSTESFPGSRTPPILAIARWERRLPGLT